MKAGTPLESVATGRSSDYAELKRIIKEQGLLSSQPRYYLGKALLNLTMLTAAIFIAVTTSNWLVLVLDAIFLGFVSTQIALLAHDIGHRQAFRGRRQATFARYFFGNLL